MVEAYAGPEVGVQTMKASEWVRTSIVFEKHTLYLYIVLYFVSFSVAEK